MNIITVHIIASAVLVMIAAVYFWPKDEPEPARHTDRDDDDSPLNEFLPEAEIERLRKAECMRTP